MKRWSIILVSCMGLSGCFGGFSPSADFYYLKAIPTAQPYTVNPISINVESVTLPATIDRPQIVTMEKDGIQVQINEMHRWSESFDSLFKSTLAEDLGLALKGANVYTNTDVFDTHTYAVTVDIQQFWGSFDGVITLDALWQIQDESGKQVYAKRSVLTKKTGSDFTSYVKTQSELVSRLAGIVAKQIAGQK